MEKSATKKNGFDKDQRRKEIEASRQQMNNRITLINRDQPTRFDWPFIIYNVIGMAESLKAKMIEEEKNFVLGQCNTYRYHASAIFKKEFGAEYYRLVFFLKTHKA